MKKKDILKIIVIFLIIFCIIGIVKIMDYIKEVKLVDGIHTQKDLDMIEEQVKDYVSDKVMPRGLSKLYGNYDGENDLNDMYRSLYNFVNYISILSKKVEYNDEASVDSFYQNNSEDIEKNLGIKIKSDFKDFIEYLNKVGYKGEKFLECKIDSSTFKNEKKYFSFDLNFNFENFENEFKIKVNFANKETIIPQTYYSIIEDNIE